MRDTFGKEFVDFYKYYIRDLDPIDRLPVPHPWDQTQRRLDTREPPPPSEEVEPESAREAEAPGRVLPGVYLDSGIRKAEPGESQTPRPPPGGHAAGPDKASVPPPATSGGVSGIDAGAPPNE
jgi:hypothetical protein